MCENVSVNGVVEGFVIIEFNIERLSNDLDMNGKYSVSWMCFVLEDGDNVIELLFVVVDKKVCEYLCDDYKSKW